MFVDTLMYKYHTRPHVKARPNYYASFTQIGSIAKTVILVSIEMLHSYICKRTSVKSVTVN